MIARLSAIPVDGRQSETALAVGRGVGRMLVARGRTVLYEMTFPNARRADVVSIAASGEVWIVEIKSSVADLRADAKWPDYRKYCDRLYFAAPPELPMDIFPADAGFIHADAHGAEILRDPEEHRLAPATRRAVTLRFARLAALRIHALHDPGLSAGDEIV